MGERCGFLRVFLAGFLLIVLILKQLMLFILIKYHLLIGV